MAEVETSFGSESGRGTLLRRKDSGGEEGVVRFGGMEVFLGF